MAEAQKRVGVRTQWLGRRQFEAIGPSGYPVRMDAKEEYGGEGKGSSPLELLLVGLTGCIGIGVTQLLEKMRQSLESLEIEADGLREPKLPHAITQIHLTFRATGEVAPSRIWQAVKLEAEQYCPVAKSLHAEIILHVILNGEEVPMPEE